MKYTELNPVPGPQGKTDERPRRRPRGPGERGAALIVAIGVLTFLLATSVVFFQMSRQEMQAATNVSNQARADLMKDGALALAVAFINHDAVVHPTFTSLDHAWKTYFNGEWLAGGFNADGDFVPGKPWAMAGALDAFGNPLTFEGGDIPQIPASALDVGPDGRYGDTDWLYVPRVSPTGPVPYTALRLDQFNPQTNFFNFPTDIAIDPLPNGEFDVITRAEWIDRWADVDNNGDGLKDSIWLPIPADRLFPEDGLDNDLDGYIDEFDKDGEPGIFLYRGNTNGLDDNGNGLIDEDAEATIVYQTVQFPFGVIDPSTGLLQPAQLTSQDLVNAGLRPGIDTFVPAGDSLDNDHNLVVNDGTDASNYPNAWARRIFDDPTARPPGLPDPVVYGALSFLHEGNDPSNPLPFFARPLQAAARIYAEPATTIVGRMAIHISDEGSKVHIGEAGRMTYQENPQSVDYDGVAINRAISAGLGPHEYELRALPAIGDARSRRLALMPMGSLTQVGTVGLPEDGITDNTDFTNIESAILNTPALQPYVLDITFPGYGRVDDDGNALFLAMNGIDDDGDGLIDEGINPAYPQLLGLFEGIDEPGEYRAFRPYRNRVAESDVAGDVGNADNDGDAIQNELGELGDRTYQTREQFKLPLQFEVETSPVPDISQRQVTGLFEDLRNFITIHSSNRNHRNQVFPTEPTLRGLTGLKLNYNLATAEEISRSIKEDFGYLGPTLLPPQTPSVGVPSEVQAWALGLRQAGVSTFVPSQTISGIFGGLAYVAVGPVLIPEDNELKADQIAVNIVDNRDQGHARSTLVSRVEDAWYSQKQIDTGVPATSLERRDIEYTVSGVESIRINEVMVRAVRRAEAEALTASAQGFVFPTNSRRFDPNASADAQQLINLDPNAISAAAGALFPDFAYDVGRAVPAPIPTINPGSSGWQRLDASSTLIGDGVVLATDRATLNDVFTNELDGATIPGTVPDVIEYIFTPTPGLPPGRYYLTIDTRRYVGPNRVLTVTEPGDMQVAVKYVSAQPGPRRIRGGEILAGNRSISQDVHDTANPFAGTYPTPWRDVILGTRPSPSGDELTGWVFVETESARELNPFPLGYAQNEAYTVNVPEVLDGGPPVYLHVAIRPGPAYTDGELLAVNCFDFSQEPNHEWVELVNIDKSGPPVELDNWELEVFASPDSEKVRMRIPPNTRIAPGGSLLLGVNKFDGMPAPDKPGAFDPAEIVYNNGLGLARIAQVYAAYDPLPSGLPAQVQLGTLFDVTIPPIGQSVNAANVIASPFDPADVNDYDDSNGDGIPDVNSIEAQVVSTGNSEFHSPTKAWDRIVELEGPLGTGNLFRNVQSVEELAELVLGGGIFPNYPESDGIDNDGDNITLENDGVDNDGDDVIDESFEGIDEGRSLRARSPSHELLTGYPGSFGRDSVPYRVEVDGISVFDTEAPLPPPQYYGIFSDPPDWKEFIERRFFPGENVIITLYEGSATLGKVVDRVTYTQKDVENRSIDDIIPCPYTVQLGPNPTSATLDRRPNSALWLDNVMALDFYRSLERRHPLYPGDRFGTTNRWEATDGNYDDWAPSTGRLERTVTALAQSGPLNYRSRLGDARFDHAYSGSPLRMNLSHRLKENPAGQFDPSPASVLRWSLERASVNNEPYASVADLFNVPRYSDVHVLAPNMQTRVSQFDTAQRSYEVNYAYDGAFEGHYNASQAQTILGEPRGQILLGTAESSGAIVLPGIVNPDELHGIVQHGAFDVHTLTVAQAEFSHINPNAGAVGQSIASVDDALDWEISGTPPRAWTPLFLFEFDGPDPALGPNTNPGFPEEYYPFQVRYLFDWNQLFGSSAGAARRAAFLGGNQPASLSPPESYTPLARRWPLAARTAMYVSSVPSGASPIRPDALFSWDIDSGLQNGEYDIYVAVAENLDALRDSGTVPEANDFLTGFARNPDFGPLSHIPRRIEEDLRELRVGLEFFSDRDEGVSTSFGAINGLQPDDGGLVHYGVVRVSDNYLEMRIQNQSEPGNMLRLTRVILAPKNRTKGRLNINTTITHSLDPGADPGEDGLFNALSGIPGVLGTLESGNRSLSFFDTQNIATPSESLVGESILTSPVIPQVPIIGNAPQSNAIVYDRAGRITDSRTEHSDGRYYTYLGELVRQRYVGNPALILASVLDASSNIDDGAQFDASLTRFSGMSNLITTRSDVFEIIVTVQAGRVIDENFDGIANYRDNAEFIATSERRARMVYER